MFDLVFFIKIELGPGLSFEAKNTKMLHRIGKRSTGSAFFGEKKHYFEDFLLKRRGQLMALLYEVNGLVNVYTFWIISHVSRPPGGSSEAADPG